MMHRWHGRPSARSPPLRRATAARRNPKSREPGSCQAPLSGDAAPRGTTLGDPGVEGFNTRTAGQRYDSDERIASSGHDGCPG